MKYLILGLLMLLFSSVATAAIPNWLKEATKTEALNYLIEIMQDEPFYKITSIQSTEIASPSGQDGIEVIIKFDDSLGCTDREVVTVCSSLDETVMFCSSKASYCEPTR